MGAFVGLLLGIGLLLIWRSGPRAPQRPALQRRNGRHDLLRQAGLDGIGPAQLAAAQVVCSLAAALTVLVITSTVSIAICFAVFGCFFPVVVLRRLRRRRQIALRELWPEAVDNLASAVRAGRSSTG